MIKIDGSKGGGQILRTATSLAAIEEEPVKIRNIRGSRPTPGLKEQHLKGLRSLTQACNGEVKGDKIGSEEIELRPGEKINPKTDVKIDTAGSTGLILQQFLPLGLKRSIEIDIEGGGTYVKWAPPTDYIKLVLIPLLNKINLKANIEVEKEGFYPKGGASVHGEIQNTRPRNITLNKKTNLKNIKGVSKASKRLKKQKVAERQAKAASKYIKKKIRIEPIIKEKYVDSACPGSGILLKANLEHSTLGADALGEKGKKSEVVGKEAAKELVKEIRGKNTVDINLADQLIPYMAYTPGRSLIKTRKITKHVKTNIEVTEKLTGAEFKVKRGKIEKIKPLRS